MEQTVGAGIGIVVFLLIVAGMGLLIGVLARLALPGPDPMSWLATLGYGLVGSVAGGLISRLIHMPPLLDIAVAVASARQSGSSVGAPGAATPPHRNVATERAATATFGFVFTRDGRRRVARSTGLGLDV